MTAAKRPIGYVGLGMMGGGMASHLVKSGYPVTVYDPREEVIEAVAFGQKEPKQALEDAAKASQVILDRERKKAA
jgi:3-hydroxyisobutyrate dehydrogenase-like beta-hydroxyacid dehydrogenase